MEFLKNSLRKRKQRLSVIAIEQTVFHRLQIRNIQQLYKLNIKVRKPIILILKNLPVIQYIDNHSQYMNYILRMKNIFHISISVSGFGIFNQKYELQRIAKLLNNLSEHSALSFDMLKQIKLQFPGWRTFSSTIIQDIFRFVKKCKYLQEFYINISHAMDLKQNDNQQKENYDNQYYGKRLFKNQQFKLFLQQISQLPETLNVLDLNMNGWQGIDESIVNILYYNLKTISKKINNLSVLKLHLNSWNKYPSIIDKQSILALFRCLQQFEYLIQISLDLRNWNNDQNVKRLKQYFGKGQVRKQGSNFNGSYLKSSFGSYIKFKQIKNLKVIILD